MPEQRVTERDPVSKYQALKAQLFSVNAMNAQTAAIINALKPTTTAGA